MPHHRSTRPIILKMVACHAIQATIALARELHAAGLSSRAIALRLADKGISSRVGTIFAPSTILSMVRDKNEYL